MGGPTGAPAPEGRQDVEPVREGRAATISAYGRAQPYVLAAPSTAAGCQAGAP
ncbi:hypothetical protein [Actinomadura pelletieri]|uniref:hypothetical protein n=1 Tax=Actinomadura pelletieri TaxID=111805 RepID=UPI0014775D39|nr:hypothetical protein [Actinomadura pelletieri]